MPYLLYRLGKFISLILPPAISYRIADICGSLYYLLARKDRKIVNNNLKVVLSQGNNGRQLHQVSRMVFVNFARYLLEFFRTSKIDLKYLEKKVVVEGKENLEKALSLGRGALLVGAHLGNWELGAMTLSMMRYPINIVVWTHKNRLINDFFVQQRQSKGVKVIALGAAIKKVFSALRNNELIGLLGDVDFVNPETGVAVQFFGRQTIMPKGPALFSLKTKAPIVPTSMIREKGNKFRLVLDEPIIYNSSKNDESDLVKLTQKVTNALEQRIALHPEQWFMLRPRWQTNV